MADDFKGDYGALGQVYSLPKEGYLSEDLSERPTISIGTTNKVRKPFLPSGELNIPTIAAANELAQRGQLTNTDNTMRDDHVNLMTEKLSGLGMDDRKAYETSRKILGGGSIAPFGIGLADVTPMGMVYGVDEAARDFKEAEGGLETAGAIGFGLLSAAEAFPLTKVASRPLIGFLKSFNSKLPPAGARADQRLSNMASGAVLSANPIGALGDVAVSTAGKVSKALTPKGIIHQAGSGATQRANTVPSYTKASTVAEIKEGDTVLDYGAGLGLGSDELRKTGANVESLELDTSRWVSDTPVTYTDSSAINKMYDKVVSLNVLNVLEPSLRNQVVDDIVSKISPKGKAVIGVRAFKGDIATAKSGRNAEEEGAKWIKDKDGVERYQKGFDGNELITYIQSRLPDGYKVEKTKGVGRSSVVISNDN
tara:strand:- start:266 stop:1537 length:1272 start_codon:yes stop_codon:yes gene_type:complete